MQNIKILLCFLIIILLRVSSQTTNSWSWECIDESKCKRMQSINGYETQDQCKLVCGSYGTIWPKPTTNYTYNKQLIQLDVTNVPIISVNDTLLQQMETLFTNQINLVVCGNISCLPCTNCHRLALNISIQDLSVRNIEWDTDESYSLQVMSNTSTVQVFISSETIFGTRHALETLSQLIVRGGNGSYGVTISSAELLNDGPKFTHRGLLIDTSRHYFPISSLERTIDAMSSCKLNTLHLHLTDTHSFPFKSEQYPQMSELGAYSSEEIYSIPDLNKLSQYALVRGVRIIPELDAPAHVGNGWQWGPQEGLGELAVCVNQEPYQDYCIQPPCGQLNPGNANVYSVLTEIYREMKNAFKPHADTVFHIGADEVVIKCWRSSETVNTWLEIQTGHNNLTDEDYIWAWKYFQTNAINSLDIAYNYTAPKAIIWNSELTKPENIMETFDSTRYVVQTWVPESDTLPYDLINLGYKVIVSIKDTWYLDWGFYGNDLYYPTWKQAYYVKVPTGALGGEACTWSELIDDGTLDSIVWPRTAAMAERLWSDPSTESNEAESRLLQWRRRVITTLGIRPAEITPQFCSQQESHCYRDSNKRVNS